MLSGLLCFYLLSAICLGFVAPSLITQPRSDLIHPSTSEQALDDDLEAGDS